MAGTGRACALLTSIVMLLSSGGVEPAFGDDKVTCPHRVAAASETLELRPAAAARRAMQATTTSGIQVALEAGRHGDSGRGAIRRYTWSLRSSKGDSRVVTFRIRDWEAGTWFREAAAFGWLFRMMSSTQGAAVRVSVHRFDSDRACPAVSPFEHGTPKTASGDRETGARRFTTWHGEGGSRWLHTAVVGPWTGEILHGPVKSPLGIELVELAMEPDPLHPLEFLRKAVLRRANTLRRCFENVTDAKERGPVTIRLEVDTSSGTSTSQPPPRSDRVKRCIFQRLRRLPRRLLRGKGQADTAKLRVTLRPLGGAR